MPGNPVLSPAFHRMTGVCKSHLVCDRIKKLFYSIMLHLLKAGCKPADLFGHQWPAAQNTVASGRQLKM